VELRLGGPRRVPRADDRGLRGVGGAARLWGRLLEDEGAQLRRIDRVVGTVVHPAPPQDAVLHRAHEGGLGALEGSRAVGQRHLVDHRFAAALVDHEDRLDADLARGVVEAP
jgi:hypothetical protein